MKRSYLDLVPLTFAIASLGLFGLACSDDGGGSENAESETGDGDGDNPGDGDGDPAGDGDGDPAGDGDGDEPPPPPPPDTDGDGVADPDDNCPDVPNPNQLDFDGNEIGNVCDTQVFTGVSGMLNTTAIADAGALAGDCQIPLQLDVTGGAIYVQLDDDAAIAGFEIVELQLADILDKECNLNFGQTAIVSLKDFVIANSGDPFPVSVPHSPAAHDAGSIAGDSSIPHPVLSTATLEASVGGSEPEPSPLELDGALPNFTANITGGGVMGTMSFADGQFVLAMDTFMVEEPLALTIDFQLRGLVGTLTLAP